MAGRDLWRAGSILAVPDHNVPTKNRAVVADPISRLQIETLDSNCEKFGVREIPMNDPRQGIVHIIGPEQGLTLPGLTVVCGDSHTSTHGAFGCLAFGIGTTEIEHVMATQCLPLKKSRSMRITVDGKLRPGVGAKDVILAIIGKIGAAGASGYVVEYAGEAVRAMSMSARMTICNMSIEAGARAGMVAVDDKTIEYVKGRPLAPRGEMWARAVDFWRGLKSDEDAVFDREESLRADDILPQVSWGTSPDMVAPITGETPDPAREKNPVKRESVARALEYMDLRPRRQNDGNRTRPDFHRLLHQRAARRFARGGRYRARQKNRRRRQARARRAGVGTGAAGGGRGRNRSRFCRRRISNGAKPAARCAWE